MKRRIHTVFVVLTALGGGIAWIVSTGESANKLVTQVAQVVGIDAFLERAPITLGSTFDEVHKMIGNPSSYSKLGEEYYSLGLTVIPAYGDRNVVGGLMASRLPSGVSFDGRLNGIKLGMSFSQVRNTLGNPSYWGIANNRPPIALWKQKDNFLTIVYFTLSGSDNVPTATQITYCHQSSVAAYHAVISAALQELRAGRVTEYFDELLENHEHSPMLGEVTFDEFRDRYSQLAYQIVGVERNKYGGANVWLLYESDDLINIWVYPLGWESPTIRFIYNHSVALLKEATTDKERQNILNEIRLLRSTISKQPNSE